MSNSIMLSTPLASISWIQQRCEFTAGHREQSATHSMPQQTCDMWTMH
jgi:hypothetical protein